MIDSMREERQLRAYMPMAIEEHDGIQGLVLRGRCHMALYRKVLQESPDLGTADADGMTHAVKTNEIAYPVAVGLHGSRVA